LPRSRMRGAVPPLPQYAFNAWCLVKARGQLYFKHYHYLQVNNYIYDDGISNGYQGPFSPELKRPGREVDHSPPSGAEVKNSSRYTSIPPIRLHDMALS
jgi:hypothetical protein